MDLATLDPLEYNVLLVVMDSCRFDTAERAKIPFIRSLGVLRRALAHADYTLPSHVAMFDGRLPTVEEPPFLPLYTDAVRQLWRVSPQRFFETKPKSQIALSLVGDTIVDGYRRLGYLTVGAASLNHFVEGRYLNGLFDKFLDYYDVKEGLIDPRPLHGFPLEHAEEVVLRLHDHEKWFLFVNAKETHYPYDTGSGYSAGQRPLLEKMQKHLNLRHSNERFTPGERATLWRMQVDALEVLDSRLRRLAELLPKNRPILVVVTADHGESFGETFYGFERCGHLHPSPHVLHVPFVIGSIEF